MPITTQKIYRLTNEESDGYPSLQAEVENFTTWRSADIGTATLEAVYSPGRYLGLTVSEIPSDERGTKTVQVTLPQPVVDRLRLLITPEGTPGAFQVVLSSLQTLVDEGECYCVDVARTPCGFCKAQWTLKTFTEVRKGK